MKDILHFLYEYRQLLARRDLLGNKLDPDSVDRLDALERLFAAGAEEPGSGLFKRRYARCDIGVWGTLKAGGRVHSVRVVNVGGGGICIKPAPAIRQGERAVVRIVSRETGREYAYPVQAEWIHRSQNESSMGMPFVGVPLQVAAAY